MRGVMSTNETFGDFDQAVNIAISKLRSALGDLQMIPATLRPSKTWLPVYRRSVSC